MAFKEGTNNIPQQSFERWNDPQGNLLISLNRDGTITSQGSLLPNDQSGQPVFNVKTFMATGDGTTDDTVAVKAAIQAAYDNGGGVVFFPTGTYLITQSLLLPNDGTSNPVPVQPPITFRGEGVKWDSGLANESIGKTKAARPGSALDLRFQGSPAKIDTRGNGQLVIERLTLINNALGTDSTPFIQTTNTALLVRDCAFWGIIGQNTCDAIVLGGGATESLNGSATSTFQGYAAVIERNFFAFIRRCVYGRTNANAVMISHNTVSADCGGTSSFAAFDFDGTGGNNTASIIDGNLIEVTNYFYGIQLNLSFSNIIVNNTFWDAKPGFLGCIHFAGNCTNIPQPLNQICGNFLVAGKEVVDTPGTNVYVRSDSAALIAPAGITLAGATPSTTASQLGLGTTIAASATAGSATLPANPLGFLVMNLGGTLIKVPYYSA